EVPEMESGIIRRLRFLQGYLEIFPVLSQYLKYPFIFQIVILHIEKESSRIVGTGDLQYIIFIRKGKGHYPVGRRDGTPLLWHYGSGKKLPSHFRKVHRAANLSLDRGRIWKPFLTGTD